MLEQLFLTVNTWMTSGSTIAALGCFLWGMISILFSPCHMASIPLIVSYVAGQQISLSARHAARYAVAFTVGLFTRDDPGPSQEIIGSSITTCLSTTLAPPAFSLPILSW
jgi:hypothetical protein